MVYWYILRRKKIVNNIVLLNRNYKQILNTQIKNKYKQKLEINTQELVGIKVTRSIKLSVNSHRSGVQAGGQREDQQQGQQGFQLHRDL